MHILLIHQNFAALNEPGGTRHHELARYLIEKGHQVTVISSRISYLTGSQKMEGATPQDPAQLEGLNIVRVYAYPALHRSFFHRLISFFSFMASSFLGGLRQPKVDLVWGTSPPIFQGVTALAIARLKGVPFVFEVRDLWPAFAVAVGVLRQPLLIRASQWLEKLLYRQADLLVINSPGFEAHVRQRGARHVEIVPNGADPRMFDPQASGAEFRKHHGLENKFVVMYAGAHGMSNDLQVVLRAAKKLLDRSDIQIVLLGDGKDKPLLQQAALDDGLHNVTFLPPVPKTEMSEALASASACIAILKPVPMYETVYPNKVFDYMAAGKPVILAIGGVIRQVVEDAQAGIYVPAGDSDRLAQAVRSLADSPEEGRLMGQRGRRCIAEHFDRAVLAEKLEKLFQKIKNDKNGV
jgi:glycosyltransferase involved in cell wall biosynthesis